MKALEFFLGLSIAKKVAIIIVPEKIYHKIIYIPEEITIVVNEIIREPNITTQRKNYGQLDRKMKA